jgi:hypothetical protein
MAVTLPLSISRMEGGSLVGAHERLRGSVHPGLVDISEYRTTAVCVIWRTYSPVIPGSGGWCSQYNAVVWSLYPPLILSDCTGESVFYDAAIMLSIEGSCTGHTLDTAAGLREGPVFLLSIG